MMPSQQNRPDVKQEREDFQQWIEQVDPARVKVIDESGLVRGLRLSYGYAPRGQRVYDTAPLVHRKRLNLVGWMGLDGSGVVATHVGSVSGYVFRGFVREHLVPFLKPGDIVVWDNHRIHGVEEIDQMIAACGATVKRLPRYSPDLNPIEMLWSKLKHYVKKARADTLDALEEAVTGAVSLVTASDARGWYAHCGFCPQSH